MTDEWMGESDALYPDPAALRANVQAGKTFPRACPACLVSCVHKGGTWPTSSKCGGGQYPRLCSEKSHPCLLRWGPITMKDQEDVQDSAGPHSSFWTVTGTQGTRIQTDVLTGAREPWQEGERGSLPRQTHTQPRPGRRMDWLLRGRASRVPRGSLPAPLLPLFKNKKKESEEEKALRL